MVEKRVSCWVDLLASLMAASMAASMATLLAEKKVALLVVLKAV